MCGTKSAILFYITNMEHYGRLHVVALIRRILMKILHNGHFPYSIFGMRSSRSKCDNSVSILKEKLRRFYSKFAPSINICAKLERATGESQLVDYIGSSRQIYL